MMIGLLGSSGVQAANPQIEFQTTLGSYVVELYPDKAPKTVANFLEYVNSGFYEGTVFHRVIDGFVVQGGGLLPDLHPKKTHGPIPNEADNGLKNDYGTLAMARLFDANSATSQFFINVAENKTLNFTRPDSAHMGYCVFGRVIRGMDVVEKLARQPTQTVNKLQDVPTQPVVIEKVALLENTVLAENAVQPPPKLENSSKSVKSNSVKKGKKKRG
jgi:peptidyl-prolyl cis-trans isomerase A (cyclophilin A)